MRQNSNLILPFKHTPFKKSAFIKKHRSTLLTLHMLRLLIPAIPIVGAYHMSAPLGLWYLCQRGIRRNTIAAIVSGILIVLLTGCMMGFAMALMLPMTGISVLLLIGLMYCLHSSLKQLDTWKAWAFPYPKASIHHDTRDAS